MYMKATTSANLTLEYWKDGEWFVGRLREVPGVLSQGETLGELEENIQDAYQMVLKNRPAIRRHVCTKPIAVNA